MKQYSNCLCHLLHTIRVARQRTNRFTVVGHLCWTSQILCFMLLISATNTPPQDEQHVVSVLFLLLNPAQSRLCHRNSIEIRQTSWALTMGSRYSEQWAAGSSLLLAHGTVNCTLRISQYHSVESMIIWYSRSHSPLRDSHSNMWNMNTWHTVWQCGVLVLAANYLEPQVDYTKQIVCPTIVFCTRSTLLIHTQLTFKWSFGGKTAFERCIILRGT